MVESAQCFFGSTRQLTNSAGEVTSAKSYDPYGAVTQTIGAGQSAYGFTGESQDAVSGMVYLRSRYYNVNDGRFQSRDMWEGDDNKPITYNRWAYANGNLLDDGQNEYVYDSANRLSSVNGTSLYSYNGLGDRLSQTVDGQVTNYSLDLNTGLTQVLADGTNVYTYGLGRISQQSGSTPEYFLGDALGSTRQLTNSAGEVTSAKSYDPYGVVTQTIGAGQSAYGFTGESQDAASGMVYLRSRYYNAADGRFQSRDTWGGDANSPMSMNRWMYVEGNPVNRTDPSGHHPDCVYSPTSDNIDYIENNYSNFLSKSDWHDTYVAAGIAVQCWATDGDPFQDGWGDGFGDAQTTDQELSKPWGKPIKNDEDKIIKFGKLCYIVTKATGDVPCVCEDKDKLIEQYGKDNVRDENPVDQRTPGGAAISMYRRIFQTLDSCNKCTATDLFVAAALAQNAQLNMGELRDISGNGDASLRFKVEQRGYNIFWLKFFKDYDKSYNEGREQVQRFDAAVTELKNRGWATPTLNRRGIDSVKNNIWSDFDFNLGR